MPTTPTAAQSEASRANGALSRGPVSAEGKARSCMNATAHGLAAGATFALLPGEDPAAFGALLAGFVARHDPADEAERLWVERLAAAAWRLLRLEALETRAFGEALAGGPAAGEDGGAEGERRRPLPSLATLARYRARIERDHRHALAEVERLRGLRPAAVPARLNPARLRWLADRAERGVGVTGRMAEQPAASGTIEPEPRTAQPTLGPSPRPANRAERRRMAALARKRGVAAA